MVEVKENRNEKKNNDLYYNDCYCCVYGIYGNSLRKIGNGKQCGR